MKNPGFFLILILSLPLYPQTCEYKTIAGLPVTFRGEAEPVQKALFHSPSAVAVGKDGSIYIADTGNHRVRQINPAGIVRTVAGNGEPAFGGDGADGAVATLRSPGGIAVAGDGSLFIADTGNNRIRRLSPTGVITTVAGEGHARFAGDGGPAKTASLNQPKTLAFDSAGDLYVWDSGNQRIRRLDANAVITTVAGASTLADYGGYCCTSIGPMPAVEAKDLNPTGFAASPDGTLYITDVFGIRRVGTDKVLRMWIPWYGASGSLSETKLASPTPVENLTIQEAVIAVTPDGTVLISTRVQLLAVKDGVARRVSDPVNANSLSFDSTADDIVSLNADSGVTRQKPNGDRVTVWSPPSLTQPSGALAANLSKPGGVAVGPDGTVYISETGANRILALDSDGQLRRFAGADPGQGAPGDGSSALASQLFSPQWLAVDSKGTLYFTEPARRRTRKIGSDGIVRTAFTTRDNTLSVRIDGQDRVYAFSGRGQFSEVIRYDSDGTTTVLMRDVPGGGFYWPGVQDPSRAPGMALAKDGTVYMGITVRLSNSNSSVVRIAPGQQPQLVPMQEYMYPESIATGSNGDLYISSNGILKRVLTDGTMLTIRNGDRLGFWGEFGYDSAPGPTPRIWDLALDSTGGLLALDTAVRRVPTSCQPAPGPLVISAMESATSNASLKLAPGQLFSVYGLRLGPDGGVIAGPDETGYYPLELSGTQLLVNKRPAPLLYAGPNQVNAIVPFDLNEQGPATIEVVRNGLRSDILPKTLGYWGPAIFSAPSSTPDLTGTLYVRMVNEDGSINGPEHPAKLGSVVLIFASGLGATTADGEDGKVADANLKRLVRPVEVNVEEQTAEILYAGTAPGIVEGVTQINLRLPKQLPGRGGCCAFVGIGKSEGVPQPNRLLFYFKE